MRSLAVVAVCQVEQLDYVHDALMVAVEADAGFELQFAAGVGGGDDGRACAVHRLHLMCPSCGPAADQESPLCAEPSGATRPPTVSNQHAEGPFHDRKRPLTCYLVAGAGFEPATSGL